MLAPLILIPSTPKGARGTKITKDQWKWMLVAGVLLFIATAMQQVGLFYTKVANAGFLTSLYAVFTPFLLWIGFREKPHWLDTIAVVMAAVGAFFISGLINFLCGVFAEDISVLSALPLIVAILYRATLSIGIGYTLQVWGQRHTSPTDTALILGLEAVFAVMAAWVALGQTLLPIQIFGLVVIFVAVLLSQMKNWNLRGTIGHDHLVEGR
jgi:drug/metabolite transporter (DMT)-like permease